MEAGGLRKSKIGVHFFKSNHQPSDEILARPLEGRENPD